MNIYQGWYPSTSSEEREANRAKALAEIAAEAAEHEAPEFVWGEFPNYYELKHNMTEEAGREYPSDAEVEEAGAAEAESLCCCFQYAGDNPDCPIHGGSVVERAIALKYGGFPVQL